MVPSFQNEQKISCNGKSEVRSAAVGPELAARWIGIGSMFGVDTNKLRSLASDAATLESGRLGLWWHDNSPQILLVGFEKTHPEIKSVIRYQTSL